MANIQVVLVQHNPEHSGVMTVANDFQSRATK